MIRYLTRGNCRGCVTGINAGWVRRLQGVVRAVCAIVDAFHFDTLEALAAEQGAAEAKTAAGPASPPALDTPPAGASGAAEAFPTDACVSHRPSVGCLHRGSVEVLERTEAGLTVGSSVCPVQLPGNLVAVPRVAPCSSGAVGHASFQQRPHR